MCVQVIVNDWLPKLSPAAVSQPIAHLITSIAERVIVIADVTLFQSLLQTVWNLMQDDGSTAMAPCPRDGSDWQQVPVAALPFLCYAIVVCLKSRVTTVEVLARYCDAIASNVSSNASVPQVTISMSLYHCLPLHGCRVVVLV